MRIGAIEKLGYFPTPAQTLALIPQFLKPAAGTLRLFDPCAGQGEALAHITAQLLRTNNTVRSYGVEVADSRAHLAAGALNVCLHCDYQAITTSVEAFSLLLLNPPYDWESGDAGTKKSRQEYIFLRNTLRRLMPGGILVYIVPLAAIIQEKVARFLSNHFSHLAVYRLPGAEFEIFGQVVVFGVRKPEPEANDQVYQHLLGFSPLHPPQSLDHGQLHHSFYPVPASPVEEKKFIFRKMELSDEEIQALTIRSGVLTTRAWRQHTTVQDNSAFTPAMPLRTGHIAGLISSGQIGTMTLDDLLAKGRSAKIEIAYDKHGDIIPDPDKEPERAVATVRTHYQTRVYTLAPDGAHREISSVADLQTFLEQHAAALARLVEQRYAPRYSQPTPAEWAHVARLLPKKRLPGRQEAGLLPAQKHVTIAAARTAKALGWVDILGEMGVGKTGLGTATVDLLGAYPALVLCPGHLVEKWKREVADVVPGARGVIVESVVQVQTVLDTLQPGEHGLSEANGKLFVIISKEKAKLGPGWQPAIVRRTGIIRKEHDGEVSYRQVQFNACPTCGAAVRDADGNYYAKLPDSKRLFCSKCKEPLFVYNGFRRWPLADFIRKKARGVFQACIADEAHQYRGKSTDQARSYSHLVGAVKYTINLTGTLFGGKSLDLFYLRYRIDPEVRQLYGFGDDDAWSSAFGRQEHTYAKDDDESGEDGKFSGRRRRKVATKELPGISPAVFRLLLKSCLFIRIADLGWGLPPYREQIGRIEMSEVQTQQYEWMYSELLATIRENMSFDGDRRKAKALLSVFLQNALARPNSAFRSETVMWRLDKTFTYQPFRAEPPTVDDITRIVHIGEDAFYHNGNLVSLPMVLTPLVANGDLLPKEAEMLRLCLDQHRRGRKVLLFVRQTGVRDIQPRLQHVLEQGGLRVAILPDSLEPARREAWIEKRVQDLDVLIVNPRRVETGLDLIKFATILFYEPDYSLYVLWQAMKRVYRLGQTQPVEIYFLVYRGTMEAHALNLVGQKMGAALLFYGDNAASAIADEAEGDGDVLAELTNKILQGQELAGGANNGITTLLQQAMPTVDVAWIEETPPVSVEAVATFIEPAPTPQEHSVTYIQWTIAGEPPKPKRKGSNGETQLSFFELALSAPVLEQSGGVEGLAA